MKITDIRLFQLHGKLEPAHKDYERVARPLDFYPEFDRIGPWPMIDSQTGMIHVRNTYVEIVTDEGICGTYGPLVYDDIIPCIRGMSSFLIGRDPLAVETLWDQMRKLDRHSRTGVRMMAISAVDIALWDIRGKVFNLPVYRLLGGAPREAVSAYVSTLGASLEIEQAADKAKEIKAAGYRGQKWFFRYGPNAGAEGMKKNLDLAYAVREAVGYGHELAFDCWMGWDLAYAVKMCRELEKVKPEWLEEPFMPNDLESCRRLAGATDIPLAGGEHLYTRWEFKPFLESGVLSVVQPDPAWTGGITEMKKLGDLCELYGVKMIPHGCTVPAAVHVVAALPPCVSPCAEYLISYQERQMLFERTPMKPEKGSILLTDAPGIGLSFTPERIEQREEL